MYNSIILYVEDKGIPLYVLRNQTSIEDIKKFISTLKRPYRVKIITKDLTITQLGFKMVSRQCIGGIYLLEALWELVLYHKEITMVIL